MQNFFDVIQNRSGVAVQGALVYVYNSLGNLATIYSDNGITTKTNPTASNIDGEYSFYAANGTYSLTISAYGYVSEARNGVVLYDPSESSANLTGAVTSVGTVTSLGSFTSAELATALTDETGSGAAVFATSPTLVTPLLGTPTSVTLTNATGLPISTGVSGLGTGVATALAVNVGTAGAPVVNGGALGTPSSGTVTNLTGTASININGTVGATTPTTGAFTSLTATTTLGVTGLSTLTGGALVEGLTVGRGAGAIATNTAVGASALASNTTGANNTANGVNALYFNTTGINNTANGVNALYSNTTGANNTANGYQALFSNTTGNSNTANGVEALRFNTTGGSNTANGQAALFSNTTGTQNTANGVAALYSNTTGINNTANGYQVLFSNTTGTQNTANGYQALYSNTTGINNTANGYQALYSNTTGGSNTANGVAALYYNTTGSGNTALNPLNSAGTYAPVFDPTTENNRFCMGSTGVTNAYIQVAWTVVSDARDKTDFAPVPHGLDFVTQLKPIAYRYKMDREATEGHGPVRYGFKAQDVLTLEGDTPVIVDAEDSEKLRFNDQSMLAVLVNAIQELKAEFDAYKATHP